MPPKRKLAEDDSKEATRSTRSSTRTKTTVAKNESEGNSSTKPAANRTSKASSSKKQTFGTSQFSVPSGNSDDYSRDHADGVEPQPTKKARTTKSTDRGKKQTKHSSSKNDDESSATRQTLVNDEDHKVKHSKSSSITHVASSANVKTSELAEVAAIPPVKEEPYTPQRALTLFETYADIDEPNVIGPEGFERLCTDANFSMEGSVPLILAWQMEAKEFAKISKEEWVSGTRALRISSSQHLRTALKDLEDLLIYGKPPIKKSKVEPYDRTKYWSYAADPKVAFRKLYSYCFVLVKPPSSKNIEMDTAVAFWSVLLGSKYPLMKDVLNFIDERGTYRAANKDLWNMMLEFCETVNPNLDNFEADGAWPTLLDEFASWKKAKSET